MSYSQTGGQNDQQATDRIVIENSHQEIASTNYWSSEYAREGLYYVSINAGAWRFLMPDTRHLNEIRTAKEVVISRGFDLNRGREAVEFLFDDHSQRPFQLTLGFQAMDRVPSSQNDAGRWHKRFICYAPGGNIGWNCDRVYYRVVSTLPCLEPAPGCSVEVAPNTTGSARSGDGNSIEEIRTQIGALRNGNITEIELWVNGEMRPFAIDPNEEFDGGRELYAAFGPKKLDFRWKVVCEGVVQFDHGHDGEGTRLLRQPKLPCFQKFRDLTLEMFNNKNLYPGTPEPIVEGDYYVFKEK